MGKTQPVPADKDRMAQRHQWAQSQPKQHFLELEHRAETGSGTDNSIGIDSEELQEEDHAECAIWALRSTGASRLIETSNTKWKS